jgi:hypothetical protein
VSAFPARWPAPERRVFEASWCRLEPLDPARHGDELYDAIGGDESARLHRYLADPLPLSRAASSPG